MEKGKLAGLLGNEVKLWRVVDSPIGSRDEIAIGEM